MSNPIASSIDVQHIAGRGIDVDLHIAARGVATFDLPLIAGKLGIGNGHEPDIGSDAERILH